MTAARIDNQTLRLLPLWTSENLSGQRKQRMGQKRLTLYYYRQFSWGLVPDGSATGAH